MSDISGVSPVTDSSPPPEVPPTTVADSSTAGAGVSGIKTLGDLEAVAKPLADAIEYAIASNICSASNRSNDRMKKMLDEAQ